MSSALQFFFESKVQKLSCKWAFERWALRGSTLGSAILQSCQIFLGATYQKRGKIYQRIKKYPECTKWTENLPQKNIPASSVVAPSKIYPNWDFFLKIYHLATLQFSQDFRSETEILQKELGKKLTMDFVDIYLIFIGNGDTVPQIFGYRM
jgi:hypothetical protein